MEASATCPYCGEPISIWIDDGGGRSQEYVEDCSVCCRPITLRATLDEEGYASVSLARLDD